MKLKTQSVEINLVDKDLELIRDILEEWLIETEETVSKSEQKNFNDEGKMLLDEVKKRVKRIEQVLEELTDSEIDYPTQEQIYGNLKRW